MKRSPQSYHHGDLRSACIRAGLDFVSQGNIDFSLRDLAKRLNVSHQAPYHHFPSREALLAAICEEGFLEFRALLRKARLASGHSVTALHQMVFAYIDFAQRRPHHYRLMFMVSEQDAGGRLHKSKTAAQSFGELHDCVVELKKDGYFRDLPSQDAAVGIWGWAHGMALLQSQGQLHWLGYPRKFNQADIDRWLNFIPSEH